MTWSPLPRSAHSWATQPPWSPDEAAVLAEAVRRAPSVHNSQPWTIRVRTRSVSLRQRLTARVPAHDPHGRDRRISCGAAVANLAIAMRGMGWMPDVRWSVDDEQPDAGATVFATHRQRAGTADGARWRAIAHRSSHREEFAERTIPELTRSSLAAVATVPVVRLGDSTRGDVAALLVRAAREHHADPRYQQELTTWVSARSDRAPAEGMPQHALGTTGVAASGLAARGVPVPAEDQLADRLRRETVFVFSAPRDRPREHFQVGEAMQRVWLEATRLGLVGSVMTQPLRLPEVREGLRGALGLAGEPQVVLRLGYPRAGIPAQVTARRSLPDVFSA
ncbi:Acg family FMN-binding oxidoreductase [Bounagaea algeriensis]